MPEIALTPQQQRFLDNYIREHRVLGRKKKADAEKFLRRKGKVLDEIYRLPDEHIPPRFREELQQADALATAGKFSDAYHLLKSAKNELRTVQCDCKPEINSLTQEVETFVTKALKAAAKWQEFEQWRRASYIPQFGNIQQTLSEGTELEPPSAESEQRKGNVNLGGQPIRVSPATIESMQRQWLEEQLAAIDRKEAAVKELDADMGRYSSKHSIISMFLEEAARKMPDFSARIADLQRWSQNSPEDQKAIRAISQQLSGRRELLCLQDPPGKFLPSRSFNSFIEQHATAVDGWRQELARQRVEVHRKVAVKSGVSGQMHEALTAASAADQSLKAGTQEAVHLGRERKPRFDMRAFAAEKLAELSKDDVSPAALDRAKNITTQAVGELFAQARAADEDKLFDLRMKSPLDFKIEYALSQGWLTSQDVDAARTAEAEAIAEFRNQSPEHKNAPFDDQVKSKFVEAQIAQRLAGPRGELADAIAQGMFQETQARCGQRLDLETGELTLGGKKFRRGQKLGEGGLGVAYAYEGEDGQRVVMKSIKAGGQNGREDMQKEIWNNRYLADADEEAPGKANVLKMLDAVQAADGTLHMVMEMGMADVNTPKMVMRMAGDDGFLPEPARALVNQYMLKQALEGVRFLRNEGMVHFDLKEENLMVMPDGSVKVLDFGGVLIHDPGSDQLPAGQEPARTKVYAPNEPDSTKHDTYAMGRAASAMQAGESAPRIGSSGRHEHLTNLTGAFGRLADAMVAKADERATLDAALESTYLRNLESYREEDVRSLLLAVMDYAQSSAAKKIAVCKERIAACTEEIAKLEAGPDSGAALSKLQGARAALEQQEKLLRELEPQLNRSEIREKAERIRELSQQLLRPASDLAERPVEQLGDFLASLQSTLDSPPVFANFISLPANRPFWKKMGVNTRALELAAKGQSLLLTKENPQAREQWDKTVAAARAAVASAQDPAVRGLLVRGIDRMLAEQYETFASDRLREPIPLFTSAAEGAPPLTGAGRVQRSGFLEPQIRFTVQEPAFVTPQTVALCQDVLAIAPVACEFAVKLAPGKADPDACSALINARVSQVAQMANRALIALAEEVRGMQRQAAGGQANAGLTQPIRDEAAARVLAESRRLNTLVAGMVFELLADLKKLGGNDIEFDELPGFTVDADTCVTLSPSILEPKM